MSTEKTNRSATLDESRALSRLIQAVGAAEVLNMVAGYAVGRSAMAAEDAARFPQDEDRLKALATAWHAVGEAASAAADIAEERKL